MHWLRRSTRPHAPSVFPGAQARVSSRLARLLPSLLLPLGIAAATFTLSAPASAFCRSTTCTGDCPRDEDECKSTGEKLFWKTACVGYSLNEAGTENLPMKHVRPAIARSFASWVDLVCDDGGTATISFSELDDVACHRTEYNPDGPNANIVLFQDTKWGYTSADNNLAKTTVTFDDETGEILDADIEINHAYNFFTISDSNVEYDLVSIVTHEVGHLIGLDHTQDSLATMNATYDRGSVDLRTLEEDDVAAACATYPSDRQAACSTEPKGGLGDDCGDTAVDPGAPVEESGCAISASAGLPGPARSWLAGLAVAAAAGAAGRRRARGSAAAGDSSTPGRMTARGGNGAPGSAPPAGGDRA